MNDNDGDLLRWEHYDSPDGSSSGRVSRSKPGIGRKGIRYAVSFNGHRLGETRSLADAKQIAQAHWELL